MKYFLVKKLSYGQGLQMIGWSMDGEILENIISEMDDDSDFRVISEDELYKLVREFFEPQQILEEHHK